MSDTRHIEYGRALVAHERLKLAIAQLQAARVEISITAGEQRAAVRFLDDALLDARRAFADVERVIQTLGRVPCTPTHGRCP